MSSKFSKLSKNSLKTDGWLWVFCHYQIPPVQPGTIFPFHSTPITQHAYQCTHFPVSYLKPVWYLRQMCDPWLLVNEFPFVQVAKFGPIKTHPEIGPKHPLMALEGNKEEIFFQSLISMTSVTYSFINMVIAFYGVFIVKNTWKSLV